MNLLKPLKKAVFPVAGLGSRFLPATKANPKEMLPIVDKPLIQYAVEEAYRAGLHDLIFVTSSSKRAIEDHFDSHYELERKLLEQGKSALYQCVKDITPPGVRFSYVRQPEALGLGHAILCARHIIGDEAFAVLLADDLIEESSTSCLGAMVDAYRASGNSQIAVQRVLPSEVPHYGIVDVSTFQGAWADIRRIIEKPDLKDAPSDLAAVGRYVFTPDIFNCLESVEADQRGEIQLTDAIAQLILTDRVQAFLFSGHRYDCGSKIGYVKATVAYALKHPELREALRAYLKEVAGKIEIAEMA